MMDNSIIIHYNYLVIIIRNVHFDAAYYLNIYLSCCRGPMFHGNMGSRSQIPERYPVGSSHLLGTSHDAVCVHAHGSEANGF